MLSDGDGSSDLFAGYGLYRDFLLELLAQL
jgi:hypothetical protein